MIKKINKYDKTHFQITFVFGKNQANKMPNVYLLLRDYTHSGFWPLRYFLKAQKPSTAAIKYTQWCTASGVKGTK